jgi:hypothetical protein
MSARRALIVANDAYERDGLRDLVAPGADAEALGRVLGDPQIGGFAVSVLRNEPAHVIQAQVEEFFADNQRDDVLLLHFSCHGLKSQSGALYLAATNTRPERLASTAVPATFVNACMQASRARSVVLLLDCCYGGAFARGLQARAGTEVSLLDSFPQDPPSDERGRAVITASGATEFAFEGDALAENHGRPSVFTAAVAEGLATGDADRDEDGWVGLDELYEYVYARVREHSPHQRPGRIMELSGELYLARSRRRRIRPEPVHPDLQAAITSDNMYARLGAVDELRTRLGSADLPAAAGAHAVLAEVARNDIQYVADRARAALGDAAIRPDPAALDFGQVPPDHPAPHRSIRLGGPPLARAVTVRPSADWISVSQDGDTLDVSVATGGAGALRGSLTLSGTPGEVVVPVTASVTAPAPAEVTPAGVTPADVTPEPAPMVAEPARAAEPGPEATRSAEPGPEPPEPEPTAEPEPEAAPDRAAARGPAPAASRPVWGVMSPPQPVTRQLPVPPFAAPPVPAGALGRPGFRPVLFAALLVLAAAVLGILATIDTDGPAHFPASEQFFDQASYVLPGLLALWAVLPWGRRWPVLAFLQGMLWPLAALTLYYVVAGEADKSFSDTGTRLAADVLGLVSSVVSAIAAVILLAWLHAATRQALRRPEWRGLPSLILVTIALTDLAFIGEVLVAPPLGSTYAILAAESVAGLGVGWYAVRRQVRPLGGALLLGWTLQAALFVISIALQYAAGTLATIAACVLLGVLAILILLYVDRRPDPETDQPAPAPSSQAA